MAGVHLERFTGNDGMPKEEGDVEEGEEEEEELRFS